MPVIYMLNKQKSLDREPYAAFEKKFKMLPRSLMARRLKYRLELVGRGSLKMDSMLVIMPIREI